jgi:gamma-glutamylcyclotransferase (GGCT)/AIG2-like uncharacterized protein YtfP
MSTENYQLFVYGSLLSGFHHPAYTYISRYFTLVGPAKVKGKLYDMGDYPAAVPVNEETYILGELYQLNHKDEFGWAFRQLDDYEGLLVEPGELPLYRREPVNIFINDSDKDTIAWIYWYNQDVTGKPVIASGSVLEYKAATQNDIPGYCDGLGTDY